MSFLIKNSDSYINIKLTDAGRKNLASGNLTFDKAVVSDREINYQFNNRYPQEFLINPTQQEKLVFQNKSILSPKDDHPFLSESNFDGSESYSLASSVFVNTKKYTEEVPSRGFWSAVTDGSKNTIGEYVLMESTANGIKTYSSMEGTDLILLALPIQTGETMQEGNLIYTRITSVVNSGNALNYPSTPQPFPFVSLWFRVKQNRFDGFTLDRNGPFHAPNPTGGTDFVQQLYQYDYNSIKRRYGSGVTVDCPVWNLNITRTSREIGMVKKAVGTNVLQSYAKYASVEYAGAKKYFGFDDNTRQVGFIHYSNESSGKTYWDSFVPGETEVDMPDLLWHRTRDENGNFYTSGTALNVGHRFTDFESEKLYDKTAEANYTLLKDRVENGLVVGRVYYDLKIIVITDPELLTAMTYKSNRNWTLPPLNLKASSNPKAPFNSNTKPGFMKKGYSYYVTYLVDTGEPDSHYTYGENFGLQATLPCQYIQKINGDTDENGNHKHLCASFPGGQFPYMRTADNFESLSGTGWGCNKVQILVQEVERSKDKGIDVLHPGMWSGCSSLSGNTIINDPAGVYKHSSENLSINPADLTSAEFIISEPDITSGNTFSLFQSGSTSNLYSLPEALIGNLDFSETGLSYGSESHFFGNIKTKKQREIFQTFITLTFNQEELLTSENDTFLSEENPETFITEIGVLNNEGELVAVGKPSHPISKSQLNTMALQLKIEF